MCLPRRFIEDVTTLIRNHDVRIKPDPVQIKQLLGTLGVETVRRLHKVQHADTLAQSQYMREEKIANLDAVEALTEQILSSGECYNLKMLNISGVDLLHIGITSGDQIGKTLDSLLSMVINGELENDKSVLIAAAKAI